MVSSVVSEMSDMSSTRKKVERKNVKNSQASDSDDESHCWNQDKPPKGFTYRSEIENLAMSSEAKEKLLKLCRKVEKTFGVSLNQREKVRKFVCSKEDLGDIDSEFKMGRGLFRPDIEEKPFNKNAFTDEEVDIIEENYYRFCEKFGFHPQDDVNIFLPYTFGKRNGQDTLSVEQLHVFCLYLSKNLHSRPPRSVYRKFVKCFYFYRKGTFTAEEDELLKSWYELNPGNHVYSILGRMLHRSRFLVRRRVMRLLGDDHDNRKEKERTSGYVPPYVEDILNHKNDEYPDWTMKEKAWKKMAKTNDQFNVKQIKKAYFQQVYPSIRASSKVGSLRFKHTLIKELSSLENPTWDNVDWIQLGEKCYKVGAVRVYSVIRTLTKKYVPREHWGDLAAALTIIKNEHRSLGKKYPIKRKKYPAKRKKYPTKLKKEECLRESHDSDASRADDPDACDAEGGSPKLKEKKVRRKSTRLKKETPQSGLAADPDSNAIQISAPSVECAASSKLENVKLKPKGCNKSCRKDLVEFDSESVVVVSDGNKRAAHFDEPGVEQQNCNEEHEDRIEDEENGNINGESVSKEQEVVVTSISTDNPAVGDSNVADSPRKKSRRHKNEKETQKLEVQGDCVAENVYTKGIEKSHTDAVEVMVSPRHGKKRVNSEIIEDDDEVKTETEGPDSGTRVRDNLEGKEITESHTLELDVDAEVALSTPRKKKRSKLDKVAEKADSEDKNEDAAETNFDAKASAVTFSEPIEGHFDSETKKSKSRIKESDSEITPRKKRVQDYDKLVVAESEEGIKKQNSVGENENDDFVTRRNKRTKRKDEGILFAKKTAI